MEDDEDQQAASELPYEAWMDDAQRMVAVRALEYAAREGLPGEHHFYVTFRTDQAGVEIPARLRAKYPEEMTIVLQHQFWDLKVDRPAGLFSVGLAFGGVSSTLVVPFAALTGFADPHIRFGLRFPMATSETVVRPETISLPEPPPAPRVEEAPAGAAEVVSLDKFRRRKD